MTRRATVPGIGRRRVLQIVAGAAAAAATPLAAAAPPERHVWRGTAMGAEASLNLYDRDPERARRMLDECAAMVARLEATFSLHRPDSALARLNRDGVLDPAPPEMQQLLGEAGRMHRATAGAFDPTVQPLWQLYARHFAGGGPEGPPRAAIDAALRRVGFGRVLVDRGGVRLSGSGTALTLNGIAQGYVTDRVADRLRAAGYRHVLVDMGETRAIGGHVDGGPWRVGIADPVRAFELLRAVPLRDAALAVSSGLAAPFDADGRHHHLLDPRTGRSPMQWRAVAVLAPTATVADGLSTALAGMDSGAVTPALRAAGATGALLWDRDGAISDYWA